jgi:hypothetical protein
MVDPEVRRQEIQKYAKYAIIGLAAAVTAPIAFWVVEGLIAWAACGLAFLVIANFAPAIGQWFANKRIAALIAAINANPIETMLTLYAEKTQELHTADQNIAAFETEVGNFDDQVDTFKQQYPADAPQYVAIDSKMHEALDFMKEQQSDARTALAEFKTRIARAQSIYKMALAAAKVTQLSGSAQDAVYNDIKEKVAFDAVRTSLNGAFANLNLAIDRQRDARVIAAHQAGAAGVPIQAVPVLTPATAPSALPPASMGLAIGQTAPTQADVVPVTPRRAISTADRKRF